MDEIQKNKNSDKDNFLVHAPDVTLPKGGGAIKSIDEKFSVNAANGTSGFSIPFPFSPSRNSFTPAMNLSYNSGGGNGIFGLGWNADVLSITRKTEKELPQYRDADNSDTFIFSGVEDLVLKYDLVIDPVTNKETWKKDEDKDKGITRYRPRIEGGFARIEKIKSLDGVYWKVTSKDNITSIFGKSENARIADPDDKSKIFKWLLEFSYDDKGNSFLYEYKQEKKNINIPVVLHEKNRLDFSSFTNTYLKSIKYCNENPFDKTKIDFENWTIFIDPISKNFLLQLILDYGEHDENNPQPNDNGDWICRDDAFSDYRGGFEIRTYRLCKRILMFHNFTELGATPCLVRSMDFEYDKGTAFTFLKSITQNGFIRKSDGTYSSKALPPLEFSYEKLGWNTDIKTITEENIVNAPVGIDEKNYQWIDLYGEGVSGILTEQNTGWYYKSNNGDGVFTFATLIAPNPSFTGLNSGALQLQDIEANGKKFLVSQQDKGYFEFNEEDEWLPFRNFERNPNINFLDPNLKFIDLNGDGRADILISEDDVFIWYASKGKEGYDDYQYARKTFDEEQGPNIVFADITQSIVLCDMSGDGLTDIVRIRNGEIVYWPNLGYGRFGKKVNMSNAPVFDYPDAFNPQFIKLADIDGSGTTDIVYLGKDSFQIYFNQSGNSWSKVNIVNGANPLPFPKIDELINVSVIDLLGTGTACIVWSSPLPADICNPLLYIDLMDGKKPHIMGSYKNNLGKEVYLHYVSSAKFYLDDKKAGKKWVTKLPFPVQCVNKVTVVDTISKTQFSNQYIYHHGYYDYIEREFRGFGRVDQLDAQTFGEFQQGNKSSPYITDDLKLYQPPMLTKTWFHTGAFLNKEKMLNQFATEYLSPSSENFNENKLPEPALETKNLTADEWREALRSCKGMILRQEIFELDTDELDAYSDTEIKSVSGLKLVKLFSTAYHNCDIQMLQPKGENRHAVFLTTESQAINYNYELDLRATTEKPDPRITHTINLKIDDIGNVVESIAIAYKRVDQPFVLITDDKGIIKENFGNIPNGFRLYSLPDNPDGISKTISDTQQELHIIYTVNTFTDDILPSVTSDDYHLRKLCETKTFNVTGVDPSLTNDVENNENPYFFFTPVLKTTIEGAAEIEYHKLPNANPCKRIIEHIKILFFKDDLKNAEPFGTLNHLAISYETYKLAFTDELLTDIFEAEKLNALSPDLNTVLENEGGYHRMDDQWWIRSGIAGFADDADKHFFLPEKYTDPFENVTTLKYDDRDLYIQSSDDALLNHTEVIEFDFRVLAPKSMMDMNNNITEVVFDILGMPAALAVKGKGDEGDNLTNVEAEIDYKKLIDFFTLPFNETDARSFLGNATARYVYYLGEKMEADGSITYNTHPACSAGIVRETHVAQLSADENSKIQVSFQYGDGSGNTIVNKIQAEPETAGAELRWIANGKTILNNKGKPVKKYEPYFTDSHVYEEPVENGVTPVMYYDAPGRLIRTEMPDGSYSRLQFTPWFSASYDQNDTVLEENNQWLIDNTDVTATSEQKNAAALASIHANTAALTFFDSMARDVIALTHNKWKRRDGITIADEKYFIYTKLDTEGKPLFIQDTRGNLVMKYMRKPVARTDEITCYDIAGNLLFQHGMDNGDRWILNGCTGKPLYAWDSRKQRFHAKYDQLHRPTESFLLKDGAAEEILVGLEIYGEGQTDDFKNNLRGKIFQHYDQSGRIKNANYDFKGNPLDVNRSLTKEIKTGTSFQKEFNWNVNDRNSLLETEEFTQNTSYDALNRMVQLDSWHNATIPASTYLPGYNERGLLKDEQLKVRGTPAQTLISGITYDAKGQKQKMIYGNMTVTNYVYDEKTFRLTQLRTTGKIVTDDNPNEIKTLQDLNYTYDPAGNITSLIDLAQQKVYFRNQIIDPNCSYEYDALYRLVHATGREHNGQNPPNDDDSSRTGKQFPFAANPADGSQMGNYSEWYEYDSAGNILKMRHFNTTDNTQNWVRQYQYDLHSNHLLGTEGTESDKPTYIEGATTMPEQYEYNEHGSMTSMPHLQQMEWDYTEHLQHIVKGTQEASYRYDAQKQRTRKIVESGTTTQERIYLGGLEIYRKRSGDVLTEQNETIQLGDGSQRMILIDHITTSENLAADILLYRYQYSNHLGSAALEIDNNNNIISYEEYHPYGTTAYQAINQSIKTTSKRYRYTGMERDEESGLNYHTARYYLPWVGRWISSDPTYIQSGLNLYAYVKGNPMVKNDSKGTTDEDTGAPEKKYPPCAEELDAGVGDCPSVFGAKAPDAVDGVGDPAFKMTEEERKKQGVPLTTAGAAEPAEAREGIVLGGPGKKELEWTKKEFKTGVKAGAFDATVGLAVPFLKLVAPDAASSLENMRPKTNTSLAIQTAEDTAFLSSVVLGPLAEGAVAELKLKMPTRNFKMSEEGKFKRNTTPLTAAEKAEAEAMGKEMGLGKLGRESHDFSDTAASTGVYPYDGGTKIHLNIGPDIKPGGIVNPQNPANSRVSMRGTLGHELIGHGEAALAGQIRGTTELEEFQASSRAAIHTPGLSANERLDLMRDANARFQQYKAIEGVSGKVYIWTGRFQ